MRTIPPKQVDLLDCIAIITHFKKNVFSLVYQWSQWYIFTSHIMKMIVNRNQVGNACFSSFKSHVICDNVSCLKHKLLNLRRTNFNQRNTVYSHLTDFCATKIVAHQSPAFTHITSLKNPELVSKTFHAQYSYLTKSSLTAYMPRVSTSHLCKFKK